MRVLLATAVMVGTMSMAFGWGSWHPTRHGLYTDYHYVQADFQNKWNVSY